MELEPVIGLEIHVQLKTKSKMFCSCANIVTGEKDAKGKNVEPNSAICPICLGYPGTLPVPNKKAIEWTQLAGAALGCKLASKSKFDRKSYFYPDLPKGYQISQYDQPFCGEGKLTFKIDGKEHTVGIERIHLEEDAAKNTHPKGANYTLVDYNRGGTPLMEIVTKPDIKSPEAARVFLQELQRIMRALGISDADMEKGQMRCDANVSLKEEGVNTLYPKTEVKNINSFKFVEKALEYEIKRQEKIWKKEGPIQVQSTRGYDSVTGKTTEHRAKEEAADYRYFPEPDIPPFVFEEEELEAKRIAVPELPLAKQERFERQYNFSSQQARIMTEKKMLADLFEKTASEIFQLDNDRIDLEQKDRKPLVANVANVILREVREIVEKGNISERELKIKAGNLAEVVVLIHLGKMSKNSVKQVLEEMQRTGGDPDHILKNLGIEQESDEGSLEKIVDEVIEENQDVVEKVKAGKGGALQFLMGQVMKKTNGKANPQIVTELLEKKLKI